MKENLSRWWPLRRRKGARAQEAGAVLFQGLRIRLTLWYCGVLGAALLLFSVTLYFSAQVFLLTPIEDSAQLHANAHVHQWLASDPRACVTFGAQGPFGPPPDQGPFINELVACFDQQGHLLHNASTAQLPSAFLTNTLAKVALQTGQSQNDTVDGGGSTGQIYRYAVVVPGPAGHGYAGVVLIGESIKVQEDALTVLLRLLLAVGGATLLIAGLGGLFLGNRALAPARLAWANQQRFIADAAHELRTPLTLLRADAEVLLRSRKHLEAEDAALLEDIVAETNHMSTLATNLLTLARLDSSSLHREHEVIGLAELVQKEIQRIKALADQKEISIEAQDNGAPYVIGDPILLEQAILALLDNAIKYNRPGGRVVVRTAAEHELAMLQVRDSGIGIPEEHLPHLGERFYRVDKARSRQAGGSGLGLSIAWGIALEHDGELHLSSTPGEGTTVTLTLPLVHHIALNLPDDGAGTTASQPGRTP